MFIENNVIVFDNILFYILYNFVCLRTACQRLSLILLDTPKTFDAKVQEGLYGDDLFIQLFLCSIG